MSNIQEVLGTSDYLVLDDIFNDETYTLLKNYFSNCKWHFTSETNLHEFRKDATKEELLQDYGFINVITVPEGTHEPTIHTAFEDKILQYFKDVEILRIKAGLFTPSESEIVHYPHIDSPEPHWTALFYFSTEKDAGETHIYNQKYDPYKYKSFDVQYEITKDKFEVLEKVEAKENRVLFFKGNVYHSSSRPRTVYKRIAVNVNFIGTPLATK